MADIISMGKRKADMTGDCRDWTPLDALREAVADIESGDIDTAMIYIAAKHKVNDEGTFEYRFLAAGATNMELSGLLAQHLHRLCIPSEG